LVRFTRSPTFMHGRLERTENNQMHFKWGSVVNSHFVCFFIIILFIYFRFGGVKHSPSLSTLD